MLALVVGGVAALFVATRLDHPVLGVFLYWTGAAGFLGVCRYADVAVFDERDRAHERWASHLTLELVGIAGVIAIPGLVALEESGAVTLGPTFTGVALSYVGLFAVFAIAYGYRRYRP